MSKLGEFIKLQGGYAFKSSELSDQKIGYPVIKIANVTGGNFIDLSKYQSISAEIASKAKLFITKSDDILIAMTGANVGRVARVSKEAENCFINQRVGRFVLKENCPYSSDFIYYLVSSEQSYNYFSRIADGAAQPNISGKMIESLDIPDISVELANFIGGSLKQLDQKIQLNTQTNQTLEQIAQAIFKSWFVDFDPVKAKINALANGGTHVDAERAAMQIISGKTDAELTQMQQTNLEAYKTLEKTTALFPSEMVESELGEVPKGWGVTNLGSVSVCFDNQRIPLSKQQREKKKGDIPYYGATSIMDYVDEAIFNGIYLLMGEDGSVIKNDGTPFLQYIWGRSWINNHAHVLQGKGSVSTEHLMLFLSCTNISAYVTGAVQLKLNQKNMNSIPFLLAIDDVNSLFYEKIKFLYEKIRANSEENDFLIKIRDSLLPKLLSGNLG